MKCHYTDHTISYDAIESITYQKDMKVGDRTNGLGSFVLNEGNFKNDQYGKYKLYSYVKCDEFVELKTKDGIVVINGKTPEETKEIYNTLTQKIK